MPEDNPVVEALKKGKEFLAAHRWTRTGYYEHLGRYCAVGALYAGNGLLVEGLPTVPGSAPLVYNEHPVRKAENIMSVLANEFLLSGAPGFYGGGVTVFNDRVAKNKTAVLDLFDRAMARASA